jgi:hypothetical protein
MKLLRFMTPLAILAIVLGLWLWLGEGIGGGWMHVKTPAGHPAGRLSPLLRPAASRLRSQPQHAQPRVVPLVQREHRCCCCSQW